MSATDEIDADIRQWRWLALKPNQLGDDLLEGLVKSMTADERTAGTS